MRTKHNLRLACIIQWISGGLAIIVIYPLFGLLLPCWRRIRQSLVQRQSSDLRSSTSQSRYDPSGKPIPQNK